MTDEGHNTVHHSHVKHHLDKTREHHKRRREILERTADEIATDRAAKQQAAAEQQ